MYKNLTGFMAADSPSAPQSLVCVMIIAYTISFTDRLFTGVTQILDSKYIFLCPFHFCMLRINYFNDLTFFQTLSCSSSISISHLYSKRCTDNTNKNVHSLPFN